DNKQIEVRSVIHSRMPQPPKPQNCVSQPAALFDVERLKRNIDSQLKRGLCQRSLFKIVSSQSFTEFHRARTRCTFGRIGSLERSDCERVSFRCRTVMNAFSINLTLPLNQRLAADGGQIAIADLY